MSPVNADRLDETSLSSSATVLGSAARGDGVFELKYLLDSDLAEEILQRARKSMPADPNADPHSGDGYRINSLYFDTKALEVFHRLGRHRRRKFRLRRYGDGPTVHLERKAKRKGLVRKQRTVVHESELARLDDPIADSAWSGHWFHCKLIREGLVPITQVSYRRSARVAIVPEGPVRLTVDRDFRCREVAGCEFGLLTGTEEILARKSILEFKFREAMPQLFKALSREFALSPASVSKYRLSVAASGLDVDEMDHALIQG